MAERPSLIDAVGCIVMMCADAKDVFPDSETALEAVTDAVNELYGCLEDGVFGSPTETARLPSLQHEVK